MTNLRLPDGRRLWAERTLEIWAVRRLEHGAGKTAKGIIHVWEAEHDAKGHPQCGQASAIDLEDIVYVSE